MELGESSVDTAKREFFEETGIEVEPIRFLNVYTNFEETYPNGDVVQTVVMLYEMKATGKVEIADFQTSETLALGFFSKDDIEKLDNVFAKHRLMIDEYFTNDFKMGH